MHVLYYVTILQFWISFKFTYYYYHVDFFDFFWPFIWRNEGGGRRRVTKGRTMRVRRTRQLKWEEVQDTVCSSRWNFAHVPLSRSLQPGKGRMAWKSRTVEVRFYKESRVLGCEGRGWRGGADASWISVFHDADGKIFTGASTRRRGVERWFHLHYALSPFCYLRLCFNDCSPFISLFLFPFISVSLSLSCRFFRLALGARGACNSFLMP